MKSTGEAKIESRVVDQDDCVRSEFTDFAERAGEFAPEPGVIFQHFPKPDDPGFFAPVEERCAGERLHSRPTPATNKEVGLQMTQGGDQARTMIIATRFT